MPASSFSIFVRRHMFSTTCTALCVLFAGASGFLWHRARVLEFRNADRTSTGESMFALQASAPLLRQHLATAESAVKQIDKNLVVESELSETHEDFYRYERETGARMSELHQLNVSPAEEDAPYRVVPYSVRLTGSFEEVAQFVRRLETGPRLLRVSSFTLQRSGPETSQVTLALNLDILGRP